VSDWSSALDRLEADVARAEELLAGVAPSQARDLVQVEDPWHPPAIETLMSSEQLARARDILLRQAIVSDRIACAIADARIELDRPRRHAAQATTAPPAYLDVSA
jgi:hypothetical protein